MNSQDFFNGRSEVDLLAQFYTAHGKYQIQVNLNRMAGMISYWNPESQESIVVGKNCNVELKKRGWFFSDFWVLDNQNSPPVWRHKLTMYNSDGDKLSAALVAWCK
jgi:hypothetical protein